jgi:hypothetical protein
MSSKPNLITCAAEIFLSEGLEDRLLSALEIGNGVGRIKAIKIFSSKYIVFNFKSLIQGICGTLVEYQRYTPKVVGSIPGMIYVGILFLYPSASD